MWLAWGAVAWAEAPVEVAQEAPEYAPALPPLGMVIGLKRPATGHSGDVDLTPLGTDGTWWWVAPSGGDLALAFDHADGPQTRFRFHPGTDPAVSQPLAHGAAVVVPLGTDHAGVVRGAATAVVVPDGLLVLGTGNGPARGAVREGTDPPREIGFQVGGAGRPASDPIWMGPGQHLKKAPDAPITAAYSADPTVVGASVDAKGRLVLDAVGLGRADVAVVDAAGRTHILPIAVGG